MKRDVVATLLLIALVFAAHGAVLSQWWLWDDPQLLYGAMRFSVTDHFANPAAWRQESSANFVPMLVLANEIDLGLFGVNPRGFYLHHLLVFLAAMLAIYAFCRMYAEPAVAWIAAAAVTLSQPAFTVASLLMDRHYAEGLLVSVGALILFRRAHEHRWRAVAGAALYCVACLEKEVFVPLPLLIVVQDWMTHVPLRTWFRNAAWCGVFTIAYVVWRIRMLGSFGGFGSASGSLAGLGTAALDIVAGGAGMVALVFAIALVALAARRERWRVAVVLLATALVVIIPVAGLAVHDSRYYFVATVAIAVLAAAAVPRIRSLEAVLFAALALLIATGGVVHAATLRPQLQLMQRDGLYLWTMPADGMPLFTGAQGWYVEGIQWLRHVVRGDRAPDAIASYPGLVLRGLSPAQVAFATPQNAAAVFERDRVVRAGFDPTLPLRVRISRQGRTVSWDFGPANPGDAFFFVTPVQELVWTRTATGWVRLPAEISPPTAEGESPRMVRVMRRSGDKWTASPPLALPEDGKTTSWLRPAA